MKNRLPIISGIFPILWGISHLIPTKNVVGDFGDISADNTNIILMEWINEGLTLIFLGSLIIAVTLVKTNNIRIKKMVYLLSFLLLIAMAVLSLFTGFKVNFLPFKLCPVIFTLSAIPLLIYVVNK